MSLICKTLIIGTVLMLGACSSMHTKELVGGLVGGVADTKMGYSASQCKHISMQCTGGEYQEWETSDGVSGCSCKM
ncbi:MAG: hypothetical protein ACI88A_002361 [Paraglaciecola sp.]|jgi:hypothetical protein